MTRPARLTQGFCERVTAPGFFSDGSQGYGLRLRVASTKAGVGKSWIQSFRGPDRKQRSRGLGIFPGVTLDTARWVALSHAIAAKTGVDPRDGAEAAHGAVSGAGVVGSGPTFAEAARDYIALARAGWKPGSDSARKWENTVAAVSFAGTPVEAVTRGDVRGEIEPIWTAKPTLARERLMHIRRVMGYADVNPNPADGLALSLPKGNGGKTHYAALAHADVAGVLAKLQTYGERPKARRDTSLALRFIALTAARPGEALAACWEHVEGQVWTIPAALTKTGREHRVPLSPAALDVLAEARKQTGGKGLVFRTARGTAISRATLARALRAVNAAGTAHGLRSTFRDWCGEQGVAREVAEAALAHVVGGVEGAYARSDLLERRAPVMEAWGQYATGRAT